MKTKLIAWAIIVMGEMGLITSYAQPDAFDDFSSYANGSSVGSGTMNGGTGWSSAWHGNGQGSQIVDNGVLGITPNAGGGFANWRYFASPVSINTSSSTYFFRTDMGVNSPSQSFWLESDLTDNFGDHIASLVLNNSWATSLIGSDQFSGGTIGYTPNGAMDTLIGEVQWSGSSISLSAWVYPVGTAPSNPGTPTWVQTDSNVPFAANIGGMLLQSYSMNGTASVGNVSYGATWNDVVPAPEPGTLALCGLGALCGVPLFRRLRTKTKGIKS